MRKQQAINEVRAKGYTVKDGEGESGDHGYGSRLYFSKPDSPRNRYNVPLVTAVVSKVGRDWLTSYFDGTPALDLDIEKETP
jgi:hypothetical protein